MIETAKQPALIRLAAPSDADGIRQIYAPYIGTPITFEEDIPSSTEFRNRMEGIMRFHPCLVACEMVACEADSPVPRSTTNSACESAMGESSERIIGFAYAHRQAERAAYDWNAELSIYLKRDAVRQGTGAALYDALMKLLALQGIRCCYARVTLPNAASERLHARFGFETMGIQRNAGFKNGAWRDVAWYVKPIGSFDDEPQRPVPFPCVLRESGSAVQEILSCANERIVGASPCANEEIA